MPKIQEYAKNIPDKMRSTSFWIPAGGGYFEIKMIGMTVGNPRKLP